MDSYEDHALVCACRGDRTVRHNRLRDVVYEDAAHGSMQPEREKMGLLPGRPRDDGVPDSPGAAHDDGDVATSARCRRRPADIFVPQAIGGTPTALDFACTSGMRADSWREAVSDPEYVLSQYDQYKRSFKAGGETETTEALCTRQGIKFVPMVIEAHSGGWSHRARQTLDTIA